LNDTSPIVSLLFWLHGHLLNLWDEKGFIAVAISSKKFQRNKLVIFNAFIWKSMIFVPPNFFTRKSGEGSQCQLTFDQKFSILI